jgi:hypothetical protein
MSDTPRTNAATFYADTSETKTELCVTEEFARTLERENAALREQVIQERTRADLAGYERDYLKSKSTREWVGLTDEEAAECWSTSAVASWKAIESKLKEKNSGPQQDTK